eukprot:scaffold1573_cov125-Isochrysis_galbana.AAC.9
MSPCIKSASNIEHTRYSGLSVVRATTPAHPNPTWWGSQQHQAHFLYFSASTIGPGAGIWLRSHLHGGQQDHRHSRRAALFQRLGQTTEAGHIRPIALTIQLRACPWPENEPNPVGNTHCRVKWARLASCCSRRARGQYRTIVPGVSALFPPQAPISSPLLAPSFQSAR